MPTADKIATRGRVGATNATLIANYGRLEGAIGDIIREVIRLISRITTSLSLRSMIDGDN